MTLFNPRTFAIVVSTAILATPAFAQSSTRSAETLLEDYGSAERIQRSGSLRMLSQRISATTCNWVAGVATADAQKYLQRSIRDYRRILAGLENGDNGLGLYGPEDDRIVLREIVALNALWRPINTAFETTELDAMSSEHINTVASAAPELLSKSKELLGFVVAEYSDPTQMLQSDAVLLQIAERQRMLEQEIANTTCLIGEGVNVEASRDSLAEAIPLYEVSLAALRTGMPDAGVAPPPTAAIDLWLSDIADRWGAVRPTLDAIAAGGDVDQADRLLIFEEMNKLTWMMNVTVGQYTEASKLKQSFQN